MTDSEKKNYPYYVKVLKPFQVTLPPDNLWLAKLFFSAWEQDEDGSITGMRVLCDLGHGYGFDNGTKPAVLRVGEEVTFTYEYTSTTEGGSDWEDGMTQFTVTLIPAE